MHRPGWWRGGPLAGRPGPSSAQGCCFVCSLSAAAPTPKNHIPGTPENGSITERGRVAECRGRRGGWSKNPGENLFFSGLKKKTQWKWLWCEKKTVGLNWILKMKVGGCENANKQISFLFCVLSVCFDVLFGIFCVYCKQGELEKLNQSTDDINRWESELEVRLPTPAPSGSSHRHTPELTINPKYDLLILTVR